jgi:hypothetical protein
MTAEEREAFERRIAELTAKMEKLDHLRKPEDLAEWGAIYEERDAPELRPEDE